MARTRKKTVADEVAAGMAQETAAAAACPQAPGDEQISTAANSDPQTPPESQCTEALSTGAPVESIEEPECEAWDSPEIMELQVSWPEATDTRQLQVQLSVEEQARYGVELADSIDVITALEERKKAAVDELKSLIAAKEEEQMKLKNIVRQRSICGPVPCRWLFGVSRRGADGLFLRDGNYKCLVRKDTGEVVESRSITHEDRTMELSFPSEETQPASDGTDRTDTTNEADGGDAPPQPSDPYDCGAFAARNGQSRAGCPLPIGEAREEWLAGYDDEKLSMKEAA